MLLHNRLNAAPCEVYDALDWVFGLCTPDPVKIEMLLKRRRKMPRPGVSLADHLAWQYGVLPGELITTARKGKRTI